MTHDAEPLALLARAVDQAGEVIAGIPKEQAVLPTPCRSWTVGDLVGHVIDDLGQFRKAASGSRPDWSGGPPAVEGDWDAAFAEGADALFDAWRAAGDLSGTVDLPIGTVPVSFVVNQQVAEFAVHTWDLATATHQDVDLDPDVGQAALDWAKTALRPEFRGDEASGKSFGPEVDVPPGAPIYDRLAAFFGRHVD
jgi:uncharacterized protein (TIGR03086 family)